MFIPKEQERVETLRSCGILDTPREDQFDRVVFEATQICRTPMALVAFIDSDRVWMKAKVGFDLREVPRSDSFCAAILFCADLLVVEDAREDSRFARNKHVAGPPFVRFYAGVPIRAAIDVPIGALCVLDTRPRKLTAEQIGHLSALAHAVEHLLWPPS